MSMTFKLKNSLLNNVYSPLHKRTFIKIRKVFQKIENFETPERFKGTLIEKWGKFWKHLFCDYKEAIVDLGKNYKERPVKSWFYTSVIGASIFFAKHNPDDISFQEEVLQNSMKLIHVGESIRNPISVDHIQFLNDCYAQGIIRRLNLGIISFIWLDNYSDKCFLYKTICPYLKPRYLTFYERIIDVGFMDKWWVIKKKMTDYDINEQEYLVLDEVSQSLLLPT